MFMGLLDCAFFQVYVHVDEEKKRKKVQNNYFKKITYNIS